MKLRANERIELENAINTLDRIKRRLLEEGEQDRLPASRIMIERARGAITNLLTWESL